MAINSIDEIKDERFREIFKVMIKKWYNGDAETALREYNQHLERRAAARRKGNRLPAISLDTAEMRLKIPRQ